MSKFQRNSESTQKKNNVSTRKPRHLRSRGQEDKEEQSTAKSKRHVAKKTKKAKAPPQALSPAPQLSLPKKDKKDMGNVEDEIASAIGTGLSTHSTVTTISTVSVKDLSIAPHTPPAKEVAQSTRKTQTVTGDQSGVSNRKHVNTPTEKWAGEAVAKGWMDKADFGKAKSDFDKIQSTVINVEKDCTKWKSNSKWNQSEDYPAFDSNLVKVESEYVNMSQIDVPLGRSVLVGQLPVKKSEESFWKVVFEKRATQIHVIIGTEPHDFFPQKAEDYRNYGQMWVNNRHVEHLNDDVCRYSIEVLPHGCSNSIVCKLTVIKNWNADSVHGKHSVVIKETIELTTFLGQAAPDENALILSHHGAGRAGFFLALSVAVNKLDSKHEPCISEIVKKIRDQRPKAVNTLTQYASLYISLFYFIKRKVAKNPTDPLGKKSVELTQNFTNALIAEANQPSVMGSVMSDVHGAALY